MNDDSTNAAATQTPLSPPLVIDGREVRLPVHVRDCRSIFAAFPVPAAAAQALIDSNGPTGLDAAVLWPGRALCVICAIDYRDSDLGAYHEVGINILARERSGASGLFSSLRDALKSRLGLYVHYLPVTATFTRDAGVALWGYPKVKNEIDLREDEKTTTATLRADGQHILTLTVKTGGRRSAKRVPMPSWSFTGGTLRRIPSHLTAEHLGLRFGGADLQLGDHPIATQLRSLGLPRPAFMTISAKLETLFHAAEPVLPAWIVPPVPIART